MTYKVVSKIEVERGKHNGGGIRYRVSLETLEPNGTPDAFQTHITIDEATFKSLEIGMQLAIPFYVVTSVPDAPVAIVTNA